MESEVSTRNGLYGFEFRDVDQRRVPEEERKTYEIKALWQRNHEIIRLAVLGYKQVEIAEILNIHPQTVSNTLNSNLGQLKTSDLRLEKDDEVRKITERVRVLTKKALDVYDEILTNESGRASLKEQKETADTVVLEMSGLRVPTRVQSQSTHSFLTKEELDQFKQRAITAARESGMIVDVEPEKVPEEEEKVEQTA